MPKMRKIHEATKNKKGIFTISCFLDHDWQEMSRKDGFIYQQCTKCGHEIKNKLYTGSGKTMEYNVGRSKDIYKGYNEGLGKHISGKRQWVEEQKKSNIKSVG